MHGSRSLACNAGAADIYVISKPHTYPFDTYFYTPNAKNLVAIYSHGRVLRVIFTILYFGLGNVYFGHWFGIHNILLHSVRKYTIIGV